jgi:hypothetical protein
MTSNYGFKDLNRAQSPLFDLFMVFLVISGAISR